jgi:hypothetical protein
MTRRRLHHLRDPRWTAEDRERIEALILEANRQYERALRPRRKRRYESPAKVRARVKRWKSDARNRAALNAQKLRRYWGRTSVKVELTKEEKRLAAFHLRRGGSWTSSPTTPVPSLLSAMYRLASS